MKRIVLCVAYLLIAVFCASGAASAEPKEPRVIREIKFDREIKNSSDSRVVVTDKEMIFLDANGNVARKKPLPKLTRIEFSKDGSRMTQHTGYDMGEKGPGRLEFKMLDENGDELWRTAEIISGKYYISQANGGTVVVPDCDEGGCGNKIAIYDKQNTKGKIIMPDVKDRMAIEGVDISDDGNYFVVSLNELTGHSDIIGQSAVVLYDISGNLLWMKHFDGEDVGVVAISSKGNFIAAQLSHGVKKESYLYIYNMTGELLLKQLIGRVGNYNASFDNYERYAVAASNNGEMYLFDLSVPKLLWKYFAGSTTKGFNSVDISSGYVAAGVVVEHKAMPEVTEAKLPKYFYLFDISGELLLKKKFVDHGISSWIEGPRVKFLDNGKRISVRLKNNIVELDNEFAR